MTKSKLRSQRGPRAAALTKRRYAAYPPGKSSRGSQAPGDHAAVHVIDDDGGMRSGLQELMQPMQFDVRGYATAAEFLKSSSNLRGPGCIVLDLKIPGMNGLELLQRLKTAGVTRHLPVIVMTAYADVATAVRSMQLGAMNVFEKPPDAKSLLAAVRAAVQASREVHDSDAKCLEVRQRFTMLTPRERALLKLVIEGRSNKQIALDLGISAKTVANIRAKLMQKTGALNGPDLVRLSMIAGAIEQGQYKYP